MREAGACLDIPYDTSSWRVWKRNLVNRFLGKQRGANNWSGFARDTDRSAVYFGTGSPSYDHWGGNRIGQNLFANCIVALDVETGKRLWPYQAVHHDLWDYDLLCSPTLVTLQKNGVEIEALAQPTKMGHLIVLDRDNGISIFPIEEKEVPQSDIPGEVSWPTQLFPIPSLVYAQQNFSEEDVTRLNPSATAEVLDKIRDMSIGPLFTQPSLKPQIMLPQSNGGS